MVGTSGRQQWTLKVCINYCCLRGYGVVVDRGGGVTWVRRGWWFTHDSGAVVVGRDVPITKIDC